MDTNTIFNPRQQPQTLSPITNTTRRTSTDSNSSPEFEFWMLRNPSFPQPNLLSADQLIHDGVLLPLHLLPTTTIKPDPSQPDSEPATSEPPPHDSDPEPGSRPESSPAITESSSSSSSSSSSTLSASKRWKDIFKKKSAENNNSTEDRDKEKEKEREKGKKKERKTGSAVGGGSAAELNINIWPFSRSRSAGNATTRPRLFSGAPTTRKVNSAPCSRSNSAGESKSRKWPSSPGRAGVHVGRSSPVWQVRRAKNPEMERAQNGEKGPKKKENSATWRRSKVGSGGTKGRVLNLNVPMCIGYRQHLSCRSDENGAVCDAADVRGGSNNSDNADGGDANDGGISGNLFNLRNLFTKKSILTSH